MAKRLLTTAEVAKLTGTPVSTTRRRLHVVRRQHPEIARSYQPEGTPCRKWVWVRSEVERLMLDTGGGDETKLRAELAAVKKRLARLERAFKEATR